MASMTRHLLRKHTSTHSLFPFLAVLVCTLGALIVLLVTVVQRARFDARSESAQRVEQQLADLEELQTKKEIHVWRRQVLEKQRDELLRRVADGRLTLSHLEDHIRRLEQRGHELKNQAEELEHLGESKQQDSTVVVAKLNSLRREIEVAQRTMQDAKEIAAAKRRTFAIIPYEGPNGTKRRPIYIECTDQGIVLQPEGVTLRPQDFEGSLGPGNPLDAALRTTREYLARLGDTAIHGEPYPLLIVRPNGTVAYSVAREAIKSWDDEFGYELVDAEMRLEYPKPDPALQSELHRSIADARSRQSILAVAMPGRFKRGGGAGLVATGSGGFQAMGDSDGFFGAAPQSTGAGGSGNASVGGSGNTSYPPGSSSLAPLATGRPGSTSQRPAQSAPGATLAMPINHQSGRSPAGSQPLANARGENWGLPNRRQSATGFTRYIQVQCFADRLLIMPEREDYQQPTVVPLASETSSSIDQFVSGIWKRVESWGIAAEAGYWKPILRVQVAPDADGRFAELSRLLERSGLVLERK